MNKVTFGGSIIPLPQHACRLLATVASMPPTFTCESFRSYAKAVSNKEGKASTEAVSLNSKHGSLLLQLRELFREMLGCKQSG